MKEIRKFAEKVMGTKDVRLDTKLNKAVWSKGIRNLPKRIRVRISRRKSDDEDSKEQYYSLVQHIPVENFRNLQTEVTQDV